jgi:hypothetical protein
MRHGGSGGSDSGGCRSWRQSATQRKAKNPQVVRPRMPAQMP